MANSMNSENEQVQPVEFDEIGARVKKLNEEGLVDFKAEIDVNNHTSPRDLMVVLNHSLKAREEGRYRLRRSFKANDDQGLLLPVKG